MGALEIVICRLRGLLRFLLHWIIRSFMLACHNKKLNATDLSGLSDEGVHDVPP